jgi:hypothetical protein
VSDHAPQPKAPPGSDFARYLEHEYPAYIRRVREEKEADQAARDRRAGRHRCGFGGRPKCSRMLDRAGLCDEHRAVIRAIFETPAVEKATTNVERIAPRKLDDGDLFDAGDRARVPADERAVHAARWLHRVGEPVTRADFLRVGGIGAATGAGRGVLAVAVERGWIARGPGGSVLPGNVTP